VDKQKLDKQRFFFEHYGVTEHDLERYLSAALSAGAIMPTSTSNIFRPRR